MHLQEAGIPEDVFMETMGHARAAKSPICILCGGTPEPDHPANPSYLVKEGRCCESCDSRLIVAILKVPKRIAMYEAMIRVRGKGAAK